METLTKYIDLQTKNIVDIGCAAGVFTRRLREMGGQMTAVDIAENALKQFTQSDSTNITLIKGALPNTPLADQSFDIAVCTEVIAYLSHRDYRLFFAELARVLSPEGWLICSTTIDIHTEYGVERLIELAQTEFDIIDDYHSYFALFITLKGWLKTPLKYIKDKIKRDKELTQCQGLSYGWYWINTIPPMKWCWQSLELLCRPTIHFLNRNHKILLFLEKVCRLFSNEAGISHYIFIGKKRRLQTIDLNDVPIERPKRKEVWE